MGLSSFFATKTPKHRENLKKLSVSVPQWQKPFSLFASCAVPSADLLFFTNASHPRIRQLHQVIHTQSNIHSALTA
jgi:hypothetical protein